MVREVACQLTLPARIVARNVGQLEQRVAVALLPQAMHHCGHEAQHATGALALHQRGPVGVEAVTHFWMDRVRCTQARAPAFGRMECAVVLILAGAVSHFFHSQRKANMRKNVISLSLPVPLRLVGFTSFTMASSAHS